MTVLGHAGRPVAPHDLLGALAHADPWTVALLVAGGALYLRGLRRLWGGEAGRRALPRWRAWCFGGAEAVLFLALVWPVEPMAGALFGAHMLQHLLLTLAAAPLLVLARPVLVGSMAFAAPHRRPLLRVRRHLFPPSMRAVWVAVVAVAAHAVTMWAWHVPGLYEAAIRSTPVHVLEHATLLGGALPLWWIVADARGRHANAVGVGAVFLSLLTSGALAGLVTFSGEAWYPSYAGSVGAWGLAPLQDQQLAGGLMWFPGGLVYVVGGAAVFLRWLKDDERAVGWARRDAREGGVGP